MAAIRLPVSFSLAVCATAALFGFLGSLVSRDPVGDPIRILRHVEIIRRPVPEEPEVRRPRIKPEIVKPEPQPATPIGPTGAERHAPMQIDPSELRPGPDPGVGEEGLPGTGRGELALRGGSDRGAIPQVRIEPDYPPQAKARGIEGWITFRFSVAADGSVKDVEILDAAPARLWDQSTLRAVSRWRYQPRIENGRPVEQVGLVATYRFELDRR